MNTNFPYSNFPKWQWVVPVNFNIGEACTDRHLDTPQADQVAMIVEDDALGTTTISFAELAYKTSQFAQVLRNLGVKAGDRVLIQGREEEDEGIAEFRVAGDDRIEKRLLAAPSSQRLNSGGDMQVCCLRK